MLKNIIYFSSLIMVVVLILFVVPFNEYKKVDTNRNIFQSYTMVIDEKNQLWGYENINSPLRKRIKEDTYFKDVSVGNSFAYAIDVEGNLWGFKFNYINGKNRLDSNPVLIKEGTKYKKLASYGMPLAIDAEGYLWEWMGVTNIHQPILPGTKFKDISASEHKLAIDIDGNLWAWGNNRSGQLGDGTTESKLNPVQIQQGTKFQQVSAGDTFSLAIDEDGNLWKWGDHQNIPKQMLDQTKFKYVEAGTNLSVAIDVDDNLWRWGSIEDTSETKGINLEPTKLRTFKDVTDITIHSGNVILVTSGSIITFKEQVIHPFSLLELVLSLVGTFLLAVLYGHLKNRYYPNKNDKSSILLTSMLLFISYYLARFFVNVWYTQIPIKFLIGFIVFLIGTVLILIFNKYKITPLVLMDLVIALHLLLIYQFPLLLLGCLIYIIAGVLLRNYRFMVRIYGFVMLLVTYAFIIESNNLFWKGNINEDFIRSFLITSLITLPVLGLTLVVNKRLIKK